MRELRTVQTHFSSDSKIAHEGRPYPVQAASRSLVPLRRICPGLGQVRSIQVDLSRSRSIQVDGFSFFWTRALFFATVSSPSLMGYGQLNSGQSTDLQQPFFALSFSVGESNCFSGPVQSHLNSEATVACEGRPQEAHLPIQAASRDSVQIR